MKFLPPLIKRCLRLGDKYIFDLIDTLLEN